MLCACSTPALAETAGFGLPVDCAAAQTCFVQQYPDMQPGPGALDPFCGTATYDGHDGTDVRVLSLAGMGKGVPVISIAAGTVLRIRDGEPDRLVRTEADRRAVKDRECGNGLVVDHGGGFVVQYCHLRQGSVTVKSGDKLLKGQPVGLIGASGNAEFPHVHVTIRKDGRVLEPSTGSPLEDGCIAEPNARKPLWDAPALSWLSIADTPFLAIGLAGGALDHDRLVVDGPPPPPAGADGALVGWGWFANLKKNDRVRIVLKGSGGGVVIDRTTEALDAGKASYSAFAGRKGAPLPGNYLLRVELIRDGRPFDFREETFAVAP